ncbi:MAG: ABC transporter substrate-binding protein [Rhodothermales bacterium]
MHRLALLALLLLIAVPAVAQPMEAPAIPAAQTVFDSGLRSYQVGQYGAAAQSFGRAANDFEYHQQTTAARLMLGKALYAAGNLEGAASEMTAFLRAYPKSRYVDDARAIRRAAESRLEALAAVPDPTDVGIALPMSDTDVVFTQALFNGVRLAVDEHNAAGPAQPIRMVFRDTQGTERGATAAVESLAGSGVELVIGPLYSEEAVAAGAAAERERVVLIAPLATEERVSEGRRYVFQANPTFDQRGRAMARFVASADPSRRVGVIARVGTFGTTMAASFQDEFERLGGTVPFVELLPNEGAWFRLPEILGDSLEMVDALYLPVSGAKAPDAAAGALRGLDQMLPEGERGRIRVFGNTEWGQLDASRQRASQYGTAFTSDFHVDERGAAASAFVERYRTLAGVAPDRLAYAGYDITKMALAQLGERRSEESLAETMRGARPYEGLGHRIYFGGGSVNEAMFILGFRDGRLVVIE